MAQKPRVEVQRRGCVDESRLRPPQAMETEYALCSRSQDEARPRNRKAKAVRSHLEVSADTITASIVHQ